MTGEEAKRNQEQLEAEGWNLGFWYGTHCEKCCGVFPKLITNVYVNGEDLCRYECEVCGKKTEAFTMPWLAEEAWNEGRFVTAQGRLF